MINIDVAQLSHRHGDRWFEMEPVHNPDANDPERKLVAGERAFRCSACDEEILIESPDTEGHMAREEDSPEER